MTLLFRTLPGPGIAALVLAASLVSAQAAETAKQTIIFNDGQITPNRIEVSAGTQITLLIRNEGTSPAEFESRQLHQERALGAGREITLTLRPIKTGTYSFVDEFHQHMDTAHGEIVVK